MTAKKPYKAKAKPTAGAKKEKSLPPWMKPSKGKKGK
jgi:hypothetical protein